MKKKQMLIAISITLILSASTYYHFLNTPYFCDIKSYECETIDMKYDVCVPKITTYVKYGNVLTDIFGTYKNGEDTLSIENKTPLKWVRIFNINKPEQSYLETFKIIHWGGNFVPLEKIHDITILYPNKNNTLSITANMTQVIGGELYLIDKNTYTNIIDLINSTTPEDENLFIKINWNTQYNETQTTIHKIPNIEVLELQKLIKQVHSITKENYCNYKKEPR